MIYHIIHVDKNLNKYSFEHITPTKRLDELMDNYITSNNILRNDHLNNHYIYFLIKVQSMKNIKKKFDHIIHKLN